MRLRLSPAFLRAGLLAALAVAARPGEAAVPRREGALVRRAAPRTAMVALPAGTFRPLYGRAGDAPARVAAFRLDRDPVTRGDFLAFVRANPQWRRGAVKPVFAAAGRYLAGWAGDLDAGDAGDAAALRRPATEVSWFAARAYCAARGDRLPTVAEWEYAAAASAHARDAARDPAFIQQLVSRYASRGQSRATVDAGTTNAWGVRGLHDFGWEWTADFNSVLVSDDSRGVGAREHALYCASAAIGAPDPSNYPAFLRYAMRAGLTGRTSLSSLGFRCAR